MRKAENYREASPQEAPTNGSFEDAPASMDVSGDENEHDDENNDEDDDDKDHAAENDAQDDDAQNKLPRLMRACDNCRRKKVKCNGTKPSCSHCTRMKLACHYSPLVRKKRVRRSIIDKLEERLESMEQMLQPLVERLSPNDPVVSAGVGGFDLGFGFAPAPAPAIAHPLGIPISSPGYSSQIQQQQQQYQHQPVYIPISGAQGIPRELTFSPSLATSGQQQYQLQQPSGPPLPPVHIIEELMEIAITRITPTAPPVSWPRLLRRLHSGQLPEFIICATIALAARFSNRPEFSCIPRYNAGREYAKRAAELISGVVDKPDPDVVFCMVMLSMYEWGCGRGESAWSYTGMATRLAQRCRLHLVDEEDFTENDNIGNSTWATTEWRRRLWWIVYCGDRTSVIVASRPATVHDDDCVVNLPTHDHEWLMGTIPRDDEVDDTDENKQSKSTGSSQQILDNKIPDCWWMVVELYSMCSRISEFANRRRRPVRSSDIPRRAMFDILDRELEDLRSRFIPGVEFPPHTEWLLSRFANLDHGANSMFNLFALYFNIHMMYYASKIILYRSELPEYTHETISPELIARAKTVCVDAAQKQADVIRWALDNIPVENWDPKIGVWSLQGASIHVNAALSDDNVIAERSRKDLEVHLKLHVASDQYYHFNMAIITMLHHIFNLRKKQRLALGSGAATNAMVTKSDMGLVIHHKSDPDPWIVPRCCSFLGFTYNYSQLRGILNDAIKQTTYSPPEAITDGSMDLDAKPNGLLHSRKEEQQPLSLTQSLVSTLPNDINIGRRLSADTVASSGVLDLSGGLWCGSAGNNVNNLAVDAMAHSLPTGLQGMGLHNVNMHSNAAEIGIVPSQHRLVQKNGEVNVASSMKRSFSGASAVPAYASSTTDSIPECDEDTAVAAAAAIVAAAGNDDNGINKASTRGRKPAAAKAKSTRGRKPANGSIDGSGTGATGSKANAPQQPEGTQRLEQLQRLEELRARVVFLQQLSNSNSGTSQPSAGASVTGFNPEPATVDVSMGQQGKNVNGFLDTFAASIGSMANQLGSSDKASDEHKSSDGSSFYSQGLDSGAWLGGGGLSASHPSQTNSIASSVTNVSNNGLADLGLLQMNSPSTNLSEADIQQMLMKLTTFNAPPTTQ